MSAYGKTYTAKRLFIHYMKMLMEANGIRYDMDNQAELETIVDAIIEAAYEKVKEEQVWLTKT